jgi:hypothetical protein
VLLVWRKKYHNPEIMCLCWFVSKSVVVPRYSIDYRYRYRIDRMSLSSRYIFVVDFENFAFIPCSMAISSFPISTVIKIQLSNL